MIALPWKKLCANFILPCGENHYGFFLRCPTSFYNRPDEIIYADDDDEIHAVLTQAYVELAIPMPWTGDFDEFMSNRNNKLIFGRREDV